MVAAGEGRQKTYEQEYINNNIRGNYIDRLGFSRETQLESGKSTRSLNKNTNRFSMDTYNNDGLTSSMSSN